MTVNKSVTEDFCPSIVLNLIVTEPRQSLHERLCNVLMWSPLSSYTVLPKQNGRVAIVTGGTRGIGFETARHLASLGMHVIIAGNEREEGAAAVRKIHEEGTEGTAEFVFVDMTSLKSVRHFVRLFRDRALPLHVLVNNAGTMMVPDRQTEDGFEYHLGLNYLSHFLLTNLLLEIQYSSHGAYSQSKLALVLFTYCLQEQLTASSCCVTVNAVDPGMVDTALYDNLWTLVQLLKKPVAKILFRGRVFRKV
ncbi:dehydrogenase/reductase SDR family member on chromosome X [Neolamprologus brichardi]|uniref:dehydrogenase/reductase SDR family member on chromosome X n=1 Tax=Neolamprologus brichardi TaxID=32507 RepID=UPI001643835D|nr:dehydrogenase/reductase SDR family member on chromosome X [Neolamprologus brichardi]